MTSSLAHHVARAFAFDTVELTLMRASLREALAVGAARLQRAATGADTTEDAIETVRPAEGEGR